MLVQKDRRIEPFEVSQSVVQVEAIDIGDDATGREFGSQNDKKAPREREAFEAGAALRGGTRASPASQSILCPTGQPRELSFRKAVLSESHERSRSLIFQ